MNATHGPSDASGVSVAAGGLLDEVAASETRPDGVEAPSGPLVSLLAIVPVCGTARIAQIAGDDLEIVIGGETVRARRDSSVHPLVLAGARARGERVLAEHRVDDGWVVVGALRTQPVPGVDVAEEYTIEADRIRIRAGTEVSVSTRAASLVLRAVGEVETYAERIVSRAEGLHKIVGRMLRLN